jgi:heme exporter protein D
VWLLIPGSLIPAIVIRIFGVKQSRVVLEQVST